MKRIFVSMLTVLCVSTLSLAHGIYRLKTGDTIEIWVEQDPNLRRQVIVAPDGRIALPQAGHLRAEGLTPEGLERALANRLRRNFTTDLDITVTVINTPQPGNQTRIFITGEVAKPGSFTVTEPTTILQGIALSGGLGDFAAKKRVHIRRRQNGKELLIPFNYKSVETGRDLPDNIYLKDGDVIVVPERGLFE